MEKQEKLQDLDAEQLEVVTGGMDDELTDDLMAINHHEHIMQIGHIINNLPPGMDPTVRAHVLHQYITNYSASERYPLHPILESPQREAADAQQWVAGGNPNKRRRTS
jgi:hypothetical protein